MFRLGIIEESLEHAIILEYVKPFIYSQRIENVPEDECPIWHINEYHVPEEKIKEVLDILKDEVKLTWYIHAFNNNQLFVVLRGSYFAISLKRDDTWIDMIDYGVNIANVERSFLEDIPLHI